MRLPGKLLWVTAVSVVTGPPLVSLSLGFQCVSVTSLPAAGVGAAWFGDVGDGFEFDNTHCSLWAATAAGLKI